MTRLVYSLRMFFASWRDYGDLHRLAERQADVTPTAEMPLHPVATASEVVFYADEAEQPQIEEG